ncbi:hypothetical protein R50073_02350 [Maricurvus nonylphenolicus]|uniref:hypothetical protein n=1 Tax=Maricurvus nonylphenolicus TaxID=1008307 RepID=UPI0036F279CD
MYSRDVTDTSGEQQEGGWLSSLWLPCGCAMIGVVIALAQAFGVLSDLPDTVAVKVNQSEIYMTDYQRALALMASEKRGELTLQDKQLVLDRLIEEELLVQHGMSLDLLRKDKNFRSDVVQSLMIRVANTVEVSEGWGEVNNDTIPESEKALRQFIAQLRAEAEITWVE